MTHAHQLPRAGASPNPGHACRVTVRTLNRSTRNGNGGLMRAVTVGAARHVAVVAEDAVAVREIVLDDPPIKLGPTPATDGCAMLPPPTIRVIEGEKLDVRFSTTRAGAVAVVCKDGRSQCTLRGVGLLAHGLRVGVIGRKPRSVPCLTVGGSVLSPLLQQSLAIGRFVCPATSEYPFAVGLIPLRLIGPTVRCFPHLSIVHDRRDSGG